MEDPGVEEDMDEFYESIAPDQESDYTEDFFLEDDEVDEVNEESPDSYDDGE